jgi:hypothetical protein
MAEAYLLALVLGGALVWALELVSEKALAQDSESVLALLVRALAQVLEKVWDWALLLGAVSVLGLVLAQVVAKVVV